MSPRTLDLAALYDRAACGLLVTADDGRIEIVNTTLCQWLGYLPQELAGCRTLQSLLTMGGRIFHQTHWVPLLQLQGTIAEVKLELLHRDGQKVPVLMNAIRREHAGSMCHEVAVFVAEDRQRYEQELMAARRKAEELLARVSDSQVALEAAQSKLESQRLAAEERARFAEHMVGIVSHDLRNPLAAIQISAAVIGVGELSTRQRRATDAIERAVRRSKRLVDHLLDFTQARIGQGLRIRPSALSLHEFVAATLEELRLAFPGRALKHVAEGPSPSFADEDRLAQLLGNLVSNALTYGDPQTEVCVVTANEGRTSTLSVHNFGTPIPAHQLPDLFDAMTRGSGAGSTHSVGLGLFIVREIVRAHAGSISVESSIEKGTTFSIGWPSAPTE